MAGKLGTLALYLTTNNTGLKKGVDEAQGIVKKSISSLRSLAGMFGVGLSITGAIAAYKSMSSALDAIGKGADRISVSTRAYQELRYAAGKTAASMEQVEMATGKAGQAMEKAAAGDKKMIAALQSINLSWKDLAGLSPDKQLEKIGSALSKVHDEITKNNTAIAIFGESGTKLMPLFNSLSALREEANSLGVIISDDTIRKAEAVNDAFARLGDRILVVAADSGLIQWLDNVVVYLEQIINREEKLKSLGLKSGEYKDEDILHKVARYAINYNPASELSHWIFRTKRLGNFLLPDINPESDAPTASEAEEASQKRIAEIASSFTSKAEDLATATEELKKFMAEKLGRDLSESDLKAIEPAIAGMKAKFDFIASTIAAQEQAKKEAFDSKFASEILKMNQAIGLEIIRNNGAEEEYIKLLEAAYRLGVDLAELSEQQRIELENAVKEQEKLNKKKEDQKKTDAVNGLIGERMNSLYQAALRSAGYDMQALSEQRLQEAARRKGGALSERESYVVSRMAQLEYQLSQMPKFNTNGTEILSNDLTRRGGFAGGAYIQSEAQTNRQILEYQKKSFANSERILREIMELSRG